MQIVPDVVGCFDAAVEMLKAEQLRLRKGVVARNTVLGYGYDWRMFCAWAKTRGLDPLLFTSLMHQESDFDPYVESVARAKGLTQIIPQTAVEIATALGVKDFSQADLFHPKQNVQFGTYYFAARLKRNGSVARALAAYNAGDGNVDDWTTPNREDPDIFVEYVPFTETHDYVKKILGFYWVNRYLWAGQR